MNDDTSDAGQTDDEALPHEDVSDDALEAAAGTDNRRATMGPGSCYVPGGMIC